MIWPLLHSIHADFALLATLFDSQSTHRNDPPVLTELFPQGEQWLVSPAVEQCAAISVPTGHLAHGTQADLSSFAIESKLQALHRADPPVQRRHRRLVPGEAPLQPAGVAISPEGLEPGRLQK